MEKLKSIEPYDRSVRIHEWKTDDAVSDTKSVVSRLSAECLKTFEAIVKEAARNSSLSKKNLVDLKRSRESLILWVSGYGVLEGNLDDKLEKSRTLQRTTLQLLANVGSTLTNSSPISISFN
ncbi:hypothetical protein BKA56DRAFT_506803 [Ilyonectria sp. MPI-CAGE-AT-0026]|nr:hypothetical protein BKA56DRAFT_506803 [Ilyonectria sp. MPI-CAGE-AT-0026]